MDLVITTLRDVSGSKLLRGNHEDFVLRFIDNPYSRDYDLMNWMCNGGAATALSYDVTPAEHWNELKRMILEMLAALEAHPSHVAAMRDAEHRVVDQGHVFVLRKGPHSRSAVGGVLILLSSLVTRLHPCQATIAHGLDNERHAT
ncbi:metallophosphoesterase [Rhizobium leguminosarum bv. trifolii WSM1325]|uniref:Metallophosphoesterase n=1 Tax=Rhizobium leguminosarum bv. trifolii (strain WSM1325) TaxID=395491 RepID=C6AVQ4_RHILS|nr:hypothetical protein [Rhizobium leguminosarum]ACS55865.1 metallophosphoesterase [Rhizobium leguminosarum bv. trifolii WSM1325]